MKVRYVVYDYNENSQIYFFIGVIYVYHNIVHKGFLYVYINSVDFFHQNFDSHDKHSYLSYVLHNFLNLYFVIDTPIWSEQSMSNFNEVHYVVYSYKSPVRHY